MNMLEINSQTVPSKNLTLGGIVASFVNLTLKGGLDMGKKTKWEYFRAIYLPTVPQSQHGREDTDPRGILRSLWLQPKSMPSPNSTVLFQRQKLQPNDTRALPSTPLRPSRSCKPSGKHRVTLGRCG